MASDTRGSSLGLYLSSEVIIAVFVRSTRGRPRVAAVGTTPTPRGAMEGATVTDPPRLGQAIRSLLRTMKSRATSASVCLPPSATGMRSFRLPEVPERERRALVRGELETSGALPIGAGAFGYIWTTALSEEEREEADVFAFHTEDPVVDGVREALRVANLRLECIEPYSVSTMRAYLTTREDAGPIALLCPSESHSDLCIHDGARVRYIRRIAGGWEDIRYAAAVATSSSEATVGSGVRPVPLVSEETTAPPVGAEAPSGLTSDVTSTRTFLASDVSRSFAFYSREYKDADVPRSLVILSPRRFADDIAQTMVSVVPIPVNGEDLSSELEVPETYEGEQGLLGFSAAAGVCMTDGLALMPRVDVSRQEAAAVTRRQAPSVLLVGMGGSTVWMILAAAASIALTFMQSSAQQENARLRQEIQAEWERHAGPLRNQEIFNAAREEQIKVALPAAAALAAVAVAHGDTRTLTLKSVRLEPGARVSIEGTALTPEIMQRFADNLSKTGAVRNPTFDMMHQDRDKLFTFRIVGSCAGLSPEGVAPAGGGG